MTKVDAIERVMLDNGGSATLQILYDQIERYYPTAKCSNTWDAGLRGVLYRELYHGHRFKKLGLSIYALADYKAEEISKTDKVRMHSLIEGICVELGNTYNFQTYTADPSVLYRDNTYLHNLSTLRDVPPFTYQEIIHYTRLIDVLWFNAQCLAFPKCAFEIVDSIGTLNSALNRCLQLQNFQTKFYIVSPVEHRKKFEQTMSMQIYEPFATRFQFLSYDQLQDQYNRLVKGNTNQSLFPLI